MSQNENNVDVLNDLIRINNDRIEGYQKAIDESKDLDIDLKTIFSKMTDESRDYVDELRTAISENGGEVATGTTASGKVYRAWMDVKSTFTGKDRKAILELCEFGEDAAQEAYRKALATEGLSPNVMSLVQEQQASLKNSHDIIKKYRDVHEAVGK